MIKSYHLYDYVKIHYLKLKQNTNSSSHLKRINQQAEEFETRQQEFYEKYSNSSVIEKSCTANVQKPSKCKYKNFDCFNTFNNSIKK